MVLHKRKDIIECSTYTGISMVAHACKILPKSIARRLSEYCERVAILPEEQTCLRPNHYSADMVFVVRGRNEIHRMYALPILPRRTSPLTGLSSEQHTPMLARHKIGSRSFVKSMITCEHWYGLMTLCVGGGLLWNKFSCQGACSHPSCSTYFSWRL